jgi:hypothetical protein
MDLEKNRFNQKNERGIEMKLIYCPFCDDIFNLKHELKKCSCGKCSGFYEDKKNVFVSKNSIVFGIDNWEFKNAFEQLSNVNLKTHNLPHDCLDFKAFFIPDDCETVHYANETPFRNKENITTFYEFECKTVDRNMFVNQVSVLIKRKR